MEEVIPKYEVLYNDLDNHFMGSYLASRDFKIFMSENGGFETWKGLLEITVSHRSFHIAGMDHEPGDAMETFGYLLNMIPQNEAVEEMVSQIIEHFVLTINEKSDFSDVIQSMKVSQFGVDNLSRVEQAFQKHKEKKFPKKGDVDNKPISSNKITNGKSVFLVHGHNQGIKHSVARTLTNLKLQPIILHEQSDEGFTIIEKFEKHSNASFAVILLTYDDYGNKKGNKTRNKRARQNVILELGYFLAKLGRKRVFSLYEDGVELPTDLSGVLYTKIDDSDNWKFRLVKELKSAGFNVDANDIL